MQDNRFYPSFCHYGVNKFSFPCTFKKAYMHIQNLVEIGSMVSEKSKFKSSYICKGHWANVKISH